MARTFYDVLMISPRADGDVITVVFRHLAKRYHPDKDPSPQAAARMAELNEAYAVLGNDAKRARYDEQVGLLAADTPTLIAGDSRPTRRGGVDASGQGAYGEAGTPPTTPGASGKPLTFGRYRGWTLNQVRRYDPDYLEWLSRSTMGRTWRGELDALLRLRR